MSNYQTYMKDMVRRHDANRERQNRILAESGFIPASNDRCREIYLDITDGYDDVLRQAVRFYEYGKLGGHASVTLYQAFEAIARYRQDGNFDNIRKYAPEFATYDEFEGGIKCR